MESAPCRSSQHRHGLVARLHPDTRFKRPEDRDVAGLEFMPRVGWQTAEDNVILKTKLKHFERFVRPEAIVNQHPRFLISKRFSFRVEDELKLL
jgi:hypothetical protein